MDAVPDAVFIADVEFQLNGHPGSLARGRASDDGPDAVNRQAAPFGNGRGNAVASAESAPHRQFIRWLRRRLWEERARVSRGAEPAIQG